MPDPSRRPTSKGFSRQESDRSRKTGGQVPSMVNATLIQALSGDALKVGVLLPEASGPDFPETATGRDVAVVYLWGVQAPRPGQPFGKAATEAAAQLCRGRHLRVATRSAGPEGYIRGSVVAEEKSTGGENAEARDVGRALVRRGLAWQDQRGPASAQLRALEQEARGQEVGLWQQEAPTPPWAWRG
ncbi:thermonuclease family protein [Salinibacter grassmerensis]|uniref:thermonuclease family protein n=1 Tax=Salinibacter grassmerensis TaxID=3040353 RepID=UPI0021E93B5A|nr:thermonuclease family protein [Salinibacter grassmerensis]